MGLNYGGINYVKKTKNPLLLVKVSDNEPIETYSCFELKDGRILSICKNLINIHNLENPTLIDIQIKENLIGLIELNDGLLILYYYDNIKLIKLSKNAYEIIQNIKVNNVHNDHLSINAVTQLYNDIIIFALWESNYYLGSISYYRYDKINKKLIYLSNIALSDILSICCITELNNEELLLLSKNNGPFEGITFSFYNIKNQNISLTLNYNFLSYPILLNKDYILIGNFEKIEIFDIHEHKVYKTINIKDFGYDYKIMTFLKLDEKALYVGDNVGNIYEYYILIFDNTNLVLKDVFKAHDSRVIYFSKYKGNKIISTSENNKIKIWKLKSYNNNY